jgi:hypothetical protein
MRIFHAVVCQGQDVAKIRRNAAPTVSEVVMDAVNHDPDAVPCRVLEQIYQGSLNQRLITLPADGAILAFAAPRDCKQLTFGGRGEQDIAQAQATFSEPRLSTSDTPLPRIRPIVRG